MDPRRPLLEAELHRLGRELDQIERQWNRKHLLGFLALAAFPAYALAGPLAAGICVVCAPALVATQAYLLAVRRTECRQLIEETRVELRRLDRQPAQASLAP